VSDQIDGTAPPGETVVVRLWQLEGYAQTTATAGGGGTFTADLGGIADLRPRDTFLVALADAEGDESLLWSGAPHLDAFLGLSSWDSCVKWRVDGPFLPVTLTLETSTGVYTRESPMGPSDAGNSGGRFCYQVWGPGWGPIEFTPGDTVTVQSPTWEGSLVIPEVTWTVDTVNDQISGEAPAGEVEVAVHDWQADRYPAGSSAVETAIAASTYVAAFPDFDVRDGGVIDVHYYEPVTDYGAWYYGWGNLEYQYFQATMHGEVEGVAPHVNEPVTATLYAADGTELATTSEDVDDDPWGFLLFFSEEYQIEPGRWVTVTSESGWTAGLQVPELTAEADADTELIWGDGPKAWVVVGHGWEDEEGWHRDEYLLPVDGYLLDVAYFGAGIEKGDYIDVTYPAPNGNRVSTSMLWPWMYVNYGVNSAGGAYPVGHTFSITVTNSGGAQKATATVSTEMMGAGPDGTWGDGFTVEQHEWSDPALDIQPGDWVLFRSDDGYTNSVQAGTITGVIDPEDDTASGTLDVPWLAALTIDGAVGSWGFPGFADFTVALDAAGKGQYFVDFAPTDLPPDIGLGVFYIEPDLDRVYNEIYGQFRVYLPIVVRDR
jgi:hypothetical protein